MQNERYLVGFFANIKLYQKYVDNKNFETSLSKYDKISSLVLFQCL